MLLTMIMSLFSSILFGLAPCNSNCAALDQENTIEVKRKDNLIINYGYGIASPFEIFGRNDLYENFSNSFTNASTIGYSFSMPYLTSDTYYIAWNNIDISNPDNSVTNHGIALTNAYFELVNIGSSGSNRYQSWDLVLTFGNNGKLIYSVEIMYDNSATGGGIIGVDFIANSVHDLDGSCFLVFRSNSYLYSTFYNNDYERGYGVGYETGYDIGYDDAYDEGVERGKEIASDPASDIYQATYNAGKQVGDSEGYQRAISQGSTAATIFSGIVTVGLLPVNVLLTMFQYEVFGINIAGLVSGLFTIAVVIIIIRLVTGKKND